MVRLIMGDNGAGKTKQLIELVHASVAEEGGCVVCIEPGADMTYDIKSSVRLVNAGEYHLDSFECLRGFIAVCMRAITIFPTSMWTTCARSYIARTSPPWKSSCTGWTSSAMPTP